MVRAACSLWPMPTVVLATYRLSKSHPRRCRNCLTPATMRLIVWIERAAVRLLHKGLDCLHWEPRQSFRSVKPLDKATGTSGLKSRRCFSVSAPLMTGMVISNSTAVISPGVFAEDIYGLFAVFPQRSPCTRPFKHEPCHFPNGSSSSTTRLVPLAIPSRPAYEPAPGLLCNVVSGSSTVNVLPRPGELSTSMAPRDRVRCPELLTIPARGR